MSSFDNGITVSLRATVLYQSKSCEKLLKLRYGAQANIQRMNFHELMLVKGKMDISSPQGRNRLQKRSLSCHHGDLKCKVHYIVCQVVPTGGILLSR